MRQRDKTRRQQMVKDHREGCRGKAEKEAHIIHTYLRFSYLRKQMTGYRWTHTSREWKRDCWSSSCLHCRTSFFDLHTRTEDKTHVIFTSSAHTVKHTHTGKHLLLQFLLQPFILLVRCLRLVLFFLPLFLETPLFVSQLQAHLAQMLLHFNLHFFLG